MLKPHCNKTLLTPLVQLFTLCFNHWEPQQARPYAHCYGLLLILHADEGEVWMEADGRQRYWHSAIFYWQLLLSRMVLPKDRKVLCCMMYYKSFKAPLRQYIANPTSTVIHPVFSPLTAPTTHIKPVCALFNLHAGEGEVWIEADGSQRYWHSTIFSVRKK